MKGILNLLGALFGLIAAILVVIVIASESGEVVTLETRNDQGIGGKDTRVWVVEHGGNLWLRAGSADSAWYNRLVANNDVVIERHGEQTKAVAQPRPDKTDIVNELMREKYGWADSVIGVAFDRNDAIAIKLRTVGLGGEMRASGGRQASEIDLESHWESSADEDE